MSDVGQLMLAELRRIREALEGSQPLGFGKKAQPTYVFVRHHSVGAETYLWYSRDKTEGQNVPIRERDLTGYLVGVWRFDRADDATGEAVPKLNVQIKADRDYVIQTGFTTNFARTFLAGLLGLEPQALREPLTLVVEDNAGSRARPTVFCRVESRGVRMTPKLDRDTRVEVLFERRSSSPDSETLIQWVGMANRSRSLVQSVQARSFWTSCRPLVNKQCGGWSDMRRHNPP